MSKADFISDIANFIRIAFEIAANIFYGTIQNFLRTVQQGNMRTKFLYGFHPVSGEHNGCSLVTKGEQLIFYQLCIYRVEAGEGLVKNEELRFVQYGDDEL